MDDGEAADVGPPRRHPSAMSSNAHASPTGSMRVIITRPSAAVRAASTRPSAAAGEPQGSLEDVDFSGTRQGTAVFAHHLKIPLYRETGISASDVQQALAAKFPPGSFVVMPTHSTVHVYTNSAAIHHELSTVGVSVCNRTLLTEEARRCIKSFTLKCAPPTLTDADLLKWIPPTARVLEVQRHFENNQLIKIVVVCQLSASGTSLDMPNVIVHDDCRIIVYGPRIKRVCFKCCQPGHVARECPTPFMFMRCNYCRKLGHIFRDCHEEGAVRIHAKIRRRRERAMAGAMEPVVRTSVEQAATAAKAAPAPLPTAVFAKPAAVAAPKQAPPKPSGQPQKPPAKKKPPEPTPAKKAQPPKTPPSQKPKVQAPCSPPPSSGSPTARNIVAVPRASRYRKSTGRGEDGGRDKIEDSTSGEDMLCDTKPRKARRSGPPPAQAHLRDVASECSSMLGSGDSAIADDVQACRNAEEADGLNVHLGHGLASVGPAPVAGAVTVIDSGGSSSRASGSTAGGQSC